MPEVAHVYALFSALTALGRERFDGELGGKLLLYGQLDPAGAGFALAGNIAGAATLGIDSEQERLKQGIRNGFCDFLVNNLDEALRILKNEVRKKQPVSVCLDGNLSSTVREMVARGVQPDVVRLPLGAEAETLAERGAVRVDEAGFPGPARESSWKTISWVAVSAPALWLPKVDKLAAEVLPIGDERRRWLRFAPRYLGKLMSARRYLRMSAEEAERFSAAVSSAIASGAIRTEIKTLSE